MWDSRREGQPERCAERPDLLRIQVAIRVVVKLIEERAHAGVINRPAVLPRRLVTNMTIKLN